jgi:hypothetical protein
MRCWPQSLEEKWQWVLRYHPDQLAGHLDEDNFAEFEKHPQTFGLMYITQAEQEFFWRMEQPGYGYQACRFCQKEGMWNEWSMKIHLTKCEKFKEFESACAWEQFGKVLLHRKRSVKNPHLGAEDVLRRDGVVEFCAGQKQDEAAIIHHLIEDWKITHQLSIEGLTLVKARAR